MMRPAGSVAAPEASTLRAMRPPVPLWCKILLILAALWLLSPMLASTYVEAFVERLHSMALLLNRHQLALDDQTYPINTEFLYVTRLGMVQLMRLALAIFGENSLAGLRVLTISSFIALSWSSITFARRWSADSLGRHEPVWALAAILILTPGIVEPSFFFADNLVSAAFAITALALVTYRVTPVRWFAIGALFASAMLVRLDALLVAPMIVTVLWFACRDYRRIALALLCGLAAAVAVFFVSYKLTGVSLFQAIRVGRFFSAVNSSGMYNGNLRRSTALAIGFFGLITIPCVVIGAWGNFREHTRRWSFVMILVPALYYMAAFHKANEIRDFYLLGTPYVLLHGSRGLRRLVALSRFRTGLDARLARVTLLLFAAVLLFPPIVLAKDGPRAITGRFWSPPLWREWQGLRGDTLSQLASLVAGVSPGQHILIISSNFEPDRSLHLVLLENGYQLQPVSTQAGCQSIEVYTRGDATVTNIRTEEPYGLVGAGHLDEEASSIQVIAALACLHNLNFDRSYYLQWGDGLFFFKEEPPSRVHIPFPSFPIRTPHHAEFLTLSIRPVTTAEIDRLLHACENNLNTAHQQNKSVPTYAEFRYAMRDRYWNP